MYLVGVELQSSALTTRPWRNLKNPAMFHHYFSNIGKNQLTPKKTTAPETHFGLYNMGSEMHSLSATVI